MWQPYDCQWIRPTGGQAHEPQKAGFNSSNISPWTALAAVVLAAIGVAMLITIYISMPSVNQAALTVVPPTRTTPSPTTTSTSTSPSTSTTTTTTPTASTTTLCVCPGYSGASLFFPYGAAANDVPKAPGKVIYPVKRGIVYTILGDNRGLTPLNVTMSNGDSALVSIEVADIKFIIISYYGFQPKEPDPTNGIAQYHRRATAADKAILDCIIPNFKTEDGYVFTWINATANTGAYMGSIQIVVAFAADSTTYVIRNYSTDFTDPAPTLKQRFSEYIVNYKGFDGNVFVADLQGKRDILAVSEIVFSESMARVEEQKYGPC